jgi:hypothetical protein
MARYPSWHIVARAAELDRRSVFNSRTLEREVPAVRAPRLPVTVRCRISPSTSARRALAVRAVAGRRGPRGDAGFRDRHRPPHRRDAFGERPGPGHDRLERLVRRAELGDAVARRRRVVERLAFLGEGHPVSGEPPHVRLDRHQLFLEVPLPVAGPTAAHRAEQTRGASREPARGMGAPRRPRPSLGRTVGHRRRADRRPTASTSFTYASAASRPVATGADAEHAASSADEDRGGSFVIASCSGLLRRHSRVASDSEREGHHEPTVDRFYEGVPKSLTYPAWTSPTCSTTCVRVPGADGVGVLRRSEAPALADDHGGLRDATRLRHRALPPGPQGRPRRHRIPTRSSRSSFGLRIGAVAVNTFYVAREMKGSSGFMPDSSPECLLPRLHEIRNETRSSA